MSYCQSKFTMTKGEDFTFGILALCIATVKLLLINCGQSVNQAVAKE